MRSSDFWTLQSSAVDIFGNAPVVPYGLDMNFDQFGISEMHWTLKQEETLKYKDENVCIHKNDSKVKLTLCRNVKFVWLSNELQYSLVLRPYHVSPWEDVVLVAKSSTSRDKCLDIDESTWKILALLLNFQTNNLVRRYHLPSRSVDGSWWILFGWTIDGMIQRKVEINSANSPEHCEEMHSFDKSCKVANFLKVLSIVEVYHLLFSVHFKCIQYTCPITKCTSSGNSYTIADPWPSIKQNFEKTST